MQLEAEAGSSPRPRAGSGRSGNGSDWAEAGTAVTRTTDTLQLRGLVDVELEEDISDISDDEGVSTHRHRRQQPESRSSKPEHPAPRAAALRPALLRRGDLAIESVDGHSDEALSREERVKLAARYVDDALNHRTQDASLHRPGRGPAKVYAHYHSAWAQRFLKALAALHMLLALWEPPSALSPEPYPCLGPGGACSRDPVARALLGLELLLVAFHCGELAAYAYAHGARETRRNRWALVRACCVAVMILDVLVGLGTGATAPRFSRPLRAAVLASHTRRMRTTGRLIARAWRAVLAVAALVAAVSLCFAVVVSQLVHASYDDAHYGDSFGSVGAGFVTAHVLLTTENFPDALYPATEGGRGWWWLLFAPYEALGLYVVMPVLTALLYETYREEQRRLIVEDRVHERRALLAAFRALDGERGDGVGFPAWEALMAHVLPKEPEAHVRLRFNALDRDRSGSLGAYPPPPARGAGARDPPPGGRPGPLLLAPRPAPPPRLPPPPAPPRPAARSGPRSGPAHPGRHGHQLPPAPGFGGDEDDEDDEDEARAPAPRPAPAAPAAPASAAAAPGASAPAPRRASRAWALFRGASIAAQLAVLCVYGSEALGGPWSDRQVAALYYADKALLALFGVEMAARAAASTPRAFWRSGHNRFDMALLAAALVELLAFGLRGPRDSIQAVRALRVLSLLSLPPGLAPHFATLLAARRYWLSLMASALALLYAYAVLGMEAFGGLERASGAQASSLALRTAN
eukprot:tig00020995_g16917.t1